MPAHRKETPRRFCAFCGKRLERKRLPNGDLEYLIHFGRRKYCDRTCMAAAFDAKPMKTTAGWATGHYHARKMIPPGHCMECGRQGGRDVHHKDGDFRNNALGNLTRLCRSCHLKEHNPRGSCMVCGAKVKGLGFCNRHYIQFKEGRLNFPPSAG